MTEGRPCPKIRSHQECVRVHPELRHAIDSGPLHSVLVESLSAHLTRSLTNPPKRFGNTGRPFVTKNRTQEGSLWLRLVPDTLNTQTYVSTWVLLKDHSQRLVRMTPNLILLESVRYIYNNLLQLENITCTLNNNPFFLMVFFCLEVVLWTVWFDNFHIGGPLVPIWGLLYTYPSYSKICFKVFWYPIDFDFTIPLSSQIEPFV